MRNKKFSIHTLTLILVVLGFGCGAGRVFAQPTDAQLKKQLTGKDTVSVTLGGRGKIEWSSTYKKHIWTRNFTAKLKTKTPGEFLTVRGYAAYDVTGGRYVFWRTFTSSNSYEGRKSPTVAEINQALERAQVRDFDNNGSIIGEFESLKLYADPVWEWHTPNSVSFYAVAVFRQLYNGGSYSGEPSHRWCSGCQTVDKIESILRIRLYRDDVNQPWSGIHVRRYSKGAIYNSKGAVIRSERLLERKDYPDAAVRQMPRLSKAPLMTE
ncbi:MAG: hypothetical protein M3384_05875 [Acidobacteriota bacterium]|nr:hypothetical protein [Acidobacteriota bacterium]